MPFDITFTAVKLQCCIHMTQIWFLPRSSNGSVPKVNSETIEQFRSWFPVTKFCFKDVVKLPKKIICCGNVTTVRYSTNKVFMLKITTIFDYSQCTTEYGWNTSKSHPCNVCLIIINFKRELRSLGKPLEMCMRNIARSHLKSVFFRRFF